jgi:protein-S-isoprenylcysteine O-methyltransferase Ste14
MRVARRTATLSSFVYLVTEGCWILVAAVWLLGWFYNFLRAPRVVRRSSDFGLYGLRGGIVVVMIVSLLQRFVPAGVWRTVSYRSETLVVAGVTVLVVSTLFTLWARWKLGTMWTGRPTIKDQHELRTDGPYGVTRHPIYTGLMGMLLGTMLLAGFGGLLLAFVVAGVYCAVKIRTEERLLTETFGSRYVEYRQRVPAILPLPRRS